jgi:hypothetical protein
MYVPHLLAMYLLICPFFQLRSRYNAFKALKGLSGAGWNEEKFEILTGGKHRQPIYLDPVFDPHQADGDSIVANETDGPHEA